MLFHEAPSRARRKVRDGDILVSTVRTYLKAIAAVHEPPANLIASTGFCVIRSASELDVGYAGWAAKSERFVAEVVSRSVGVSYPAINASQLADIEIPLPPLATQRRIATYLDEKTGRIDALMAKKRALLGLLAEKLGGVQAVQTLSRLNRMAPGKTRCFVLDFRNEEAEIFAAFRPYYEATPMGENADPHKLNELHHQLLQPAIFTPAEVSEFAAIWFQPRRDLSGQDHRRMNAILDRCAGRFAEQAEDEQDGFRGLLSAFANLYGFLSQILPWFDEELERLYAFVRNLAAKLPPPGDGRKFTLDDDVALKFFRLQQVSDGTIELSQGEAEPLKGPTDVGTGRGHDPDVALSTLVGALNERFGTDFTEADQLFFEQVRATAECDEAIVEAAHANSEANFAAFFGRILDDLFIQRMEGNDEIFNRVMNDKRFRAVAQAHLAREVYGRIRKGEAPPSS
jgi:type I restriction enzyme R subunit